MLNDRLVEMEAENGVVDPPDVDQVNVAVVQRQLSIVGHVLMDIKWRKWHHQPYGIWKVDVSKMEIQKVCIRLRSMHWSMFVSDVWTVYGVLYKNYIYRVLYRTYIFLQINIL